MELLGSNVAIAYDDKVTGYAPDCLNDQNVMRLVSESLYLLGLDVENYDSPNWNPLVELIKPGQRVLLKPNLVMHNNPSGGGTECLYTQPAVVFSVLHYVVKAMDGCGSIVVGDAPMQSCEFERLISESGYQKVIDLYQSRGVDISLCDFRNVKTKTHNGIRSLQEEIKNDGVVIDLAEKSEFYGLTEEHLSNLRITSYDPRLLAEHHNVKKHEYKITKEILEVDVIINLPKPKTHRKAGVTGCLKNIIGINVNKEYLPHHAIEGKSDSGDAYSKSNRLLKKVNKLIDERNMEDESRVLKIKLLNKQINVLSAMARALTKEKYNEGSWHGNDTIWRTVLDVNKILRYADKEGHICDSPQRTILNLADMVICGENDGPLQPSPKKCGMIVASFDAVSMDEVITSIMGFDLADIPTMRNARNSNMKLFLNSDYSVISNSETYNCKSIEWIKENASKHFVPNPGWTEKLLRESYEE